MDEFFLDQLSGLSKDALINIVVVGLLFLGSIKLLCFFIKRRATVIRENLLSDENRQDCINYLKDTGALSQWSERYDTFLRKSLVWADNRLGGAYSAQSYRYMVLLAYIYPLALVVLFWLVDGINYSGIRNFLPEGAGFFSRVLFLVVLIAAPIFYSRWSNGRSFFVSIIIFSVVIVVIGAVFVAVTGDISAVSRIDITSPIPFSGFGAVFVAGAVAGVVAGVATVAGAFVAFGVVLSVFPVVMSFLFELGLVTINSIDRDFGLFFYLVLVASTITIIGAIVGAVFIKLIRLIERNNKSYFGLGFLISIGIYFFIVWWLIINQYDSSLFATHGIIIFMMLFPVVNSFYDWISVGITRMCLRQTLSKEGQNSTLWWRILWSVIDLLIALVLLILLVMTLAFVVASLNALTIVNGGDAQFYFDNLLQGIVFNPLDRQYLWVHLMIFSIMIPTLLHFSTVIMALFAHGGASYHYRLKMAKILEEHPNIFESGQQADSKRARFIIRYLAWRRYMLPFVLIGIMCVLVLVVMMHFSFLHTVAQW